MEAVTRVDFGRLSKAQRTPQGGLRIPARFTRSGIFEYRRADGSVSREYRPPEEVFHQDALSTLEDAPVTKLHPSGLVEPRNFRGLAVGHVRPGVRQDGEYVAGEVVIQDADAVAAVERGELAEISLGYRVQLERTPGVTPDGQRYDAVQRRITHNHAAIGPRGWGRAGRDVGLRLDSADAVQVRADDDQQPTPVPEPAPQQQRTDDMGTIRIDGVDYQIGDATARQAIEQAVAKRDSELAELRKKVSETQAKLDAAEEAKTKAEKEAKEAADPARLDERLAERDRIRQGARAILGEDVKLDGKAEGEIIREALAKGCPDLKLDDKDDTYLRARFDAAVEAAPKSNGKSNAATRVDSVAAVRGGARFAEASGGQPRHDSRTARQKMLEHNRAISEGRAPSATPTATTQES
ncbi:MAG: DUF2213 domain-containing protein [Myxococcota bacterium]